MHKLVRIIAVGTIILFGAVFSAHAQSAAEAALAGAFPTLSAIKTVVGSGTGPLIDGIIAGAGGPLGAIAQSGIGSTFLGWIGLKGIGYVMFVLSYIAGFIGSVAFTLAGLLVEFGLLLNSTILDGEVVQLGWRFCRDLANLGFTIGIVVIAYATMLGYESYGLKKLIGNFVIAAVMVNFSFSIAGFAIDISNMLTHFFVKASIGGGAGQVGWESFHTFTETLASAFSPQKLLVTNTGNIQVYESISTNDGMIAAVLSIFFVSLFTAFCALGMLMVGLTTISRFAYLSGLIIIMPLAVLCYAFPKTKGYYHKWYGDFMCQLMYLPAATFSMYIIIMFVQVKANIGLGNSQAIDLNKLLSGFEAASAASGGLTARGTLDLMMAPFRTITDMVLVLTFLFYAITKSRNIGCAGGDIALKWANGLRGWAIGTVTGAPAWAGRKVLSGGIDEEGRNRGTRLGNILSNIPLVRRLVPRLNDFAAGTSKNIGNFETQNKKLGDVQLMTKMRSLEILTSAEDMAAAAKVAAERGLFSEDDPEKGLTQKEFDRFIPAVKRYGMEADILKKLPHLYSKFGLNVEKENGEYVNKEHGKKLDDAIKALKPEDVENLPVEAFADAEIVSRFTGAHLEKLPKDKKIRDMFAETFNGLAKPESMGAEKFRQFVAKTFAKPEADAALLPALLANPLVVKGLTNANLKKLAGADKTKHREAFLDTINDPSKFSDKELQDFMRENFANSKSIDEIHPDIIRNKRFFNGLDEKHIQRMNAEPEEKQQEAMLAGLRESYKDLNADVYATNATPDQETIAKLDRMAKVIVDKKKDWQWSPLVNNDATKEAFREIEEEYHKRNPDDNELKQRKERLTELERSKKKDDDDAYGPPAPPPPPAPTTPSPYPAGGGGPAGKPTPTPTAGTATANQPARKQLDIGEAMDAALKNTDLFPSEIETKDTFPTKADRAATQARKEFEAKRAKLYGAQTQTATAAPPATPPASEPPPLSEEDLEELERMTSGNKIPPTPPAPIIPIPPTKSATPTPQPAAGPTATELNVRPITPPELNRLSESEKIRIAKNADLIIPKPAESGRTTTPEPINIDFSRIAGKRIVDEGPITPPEQKPTPIPEPIKTIVEREQNANKNQISVIPKFIPADQPKRIEYKGPVTPPPTPVIPEPIRSFLQEEKEKKDNQVERKNTL